jgi:hypothetical protein
VEKTALCCVLLTKYYSSDQIKKTEMGRIRSTDGGKEMCVKGFSEGKRPLERPRCRWKNNVNMNLREVDWEGMVCIGLTQNRDKTT